MKGKYHFRVKSKRTVFEFEIRRNITVIQGDSATGKTTLLRMMYEYLRVGRESGYTVWADVPYYVYLRREVGRDWKDDLLGLRDNVIFIEENNNFVFTEDFAEFVKTSGNYFVIVNRSPLKMLPYSIHEIYEIVTEGRHSGVKESYHELKELYSNYPFAENNDFRNIVTEDSNSGYQFFKNVFCECNVVSANGNGNIINVIKTIKDKNVLVVADGAAYGSMIEESLEYFASIEGRRISAWFPESFEYLILKSGIIQDSKISEILVEPSEFIECKEYESWERFFTQLLISATSDTEYKYSKQNLDVYYLQDSNVRKMMELFPDGMTGSTRGAK
jgi:hypothetical protein